MRRIKDFDRIYHLLNDFWQKLFGIGVVDTARRLQEMYWEIFGSLIRSELWWINTMKKLIWFLPVVTRKFELSTRTPKVLSIRPFWTARVSAWQSGGWGSLGLTGTGLGTLGISPGWIAGICAGGIHWSHSLPLPPTARTLSIASPDSNSRQCSCVTKRLWTGNFSTPASQREPVSIVEIYCCPLRQGCGSGIG